jgi:hypothetical protein
MKIKKICLAFLVAGLALVSCQQNVENTTIDG